MQVHGEDDYPVKKRTAVLLMTSNGNNLFTDLPVFCNVQSL